MSSKVELSCGYTAEVLTLAQSEKNKQKAIRMATAELNELHNKQSKQIDKRYSKGDKNNGS